MRKKIKIIAMFILVMLIMILVSINLASV